MGSIGSASVKCDWPRQKSWSPRCVPVWLSAVGLGTRPKDSLVAEEDVKKPTNQPVSIFVRQDAKISGVSLETRPQDSLVADEEVNQPTNPSLFVSVWRHAKISGVSLKGHASNQKP